MTSDLNFSLSITYVTMLFLPVNGCISIKFPIPLLLLFLNPCQSKPLTSGAQALPTRKNFKIRKAHLHIITVSGIEPFGGLG